MFERYTEKARRVIFFARWEASRYGSRCIETEHLLLGLLREDHTMANQLLGDQLAEEQIRQKIEAQITIRERISTSVEVPLTEQSKRALNFAGEEANNLGHHHIGTEHLLLGLLRVEQGMAAAILRASEIDLLKLREKIRRLPPRPSGVPGGSASGWSIPIPAPNADPCFDFVESLRAGNWRELQELFEEQACFLDAGGKRWSGREEISSNLENLLAPFATKKARQRMESHAERLGMFWIGTMLWEEVHLKPNSPPGILRMSIVFGNDAGKWAIYLLQLAAIEKTETGKTAAT